MSTNTDSATGSSSATRPRLRDLWQVPTFILGVLALTGACVGHPLWRAGHLRCLERNLHAAQQTLERPDATAPDVLEHVESLLASAERHPQHAARAHFLVGAAYLRQAAKLSAPHAVDLYRKARSHLEHAQRLGVPDADQPRLTYRLARVWLHTKEPPARVIEGLEQSLAQHGADDPAEGYALLTQVYLQLPQPDLHGALAANKKLIDLPRVDEEVLAPARLLRGELLLKLQHPVEAREILKYLKPPAPPVLVRKARYLQARTYQEEEQWARAAQNWRELLEEHTLAAGDPERAGERGRFLYNLGLCYRQMEETDQAVLAWQAAMEEGQGPDAAASALALAELRLFSSKPQVVQAALEAFQRAVRDVQKPEDWSSTLLELNRAREIFERGCTIYHATGRYELSMQLAKLYVRLAAPGMAASLYAQAAESAAKLKREQARKAKNAVQFQLEEEAARTLYRDAAKHHEEAAAAFTVPLDHGDRLWRSADCYLQGQDPAAAALVLERFVKVGEPAEKLGEGWFLLGEARRASGHEAEAVSAYNECIKLTQPGPHAYHARYQIALHKIARGAWDQAQDDLEKNLSRPPTLGAQPDRESQEQSLYELGSLLFRRRNYRMGSFRLEEALATFPSCARATTARFQLAECYRNLAAQESHNIRLPERTSSDAMAHFQKQYRLWMEKAAEGYEELARVLTARHASGPLPPDDEAILRQASFAAAEARSNLGQYNEAIRLYEPLVTRYQRRVESLHALAGIAQCHWRQGAMEPARQTVEKVRATLQEIDDAAFNEASSQWSRQEWEKWLAEVSK